MNFRNIFITSKKQLNKYVSDDEIYQFYFGDYEEDKFHISPFRMETNGSFKINYFKGKLCWRDFGSDIRPKDSITFVMKLYNIRFNEALERIYKEIYLNEDVNIVSKKKQIITTAKPAIKIHQNFSKKELEFWSVVDITKKDLIKWNVYVGQLWIDNKMVHKSSDADPMFVYLHDKAAESYTCYRPFAVNQKYKWFKNNITGHIQGLEFLPKTGDKLVITKSYKEIIVWNKAGYPAIAPHSEAYFIDLYTLIELKKRFSTIIINYDNDASGIKLGNQFALEHTLPTYYTTGYVDPYEFVKNENYEEFRKDFIGKF